MYLVNSKCGHDELHTLLVSNYNFLQSFDGFSSNSTHSEPNKDDMMMPILAWSEAFTKV